MAATSTATAISRSLEIGRSEYGAGESWNIPHKGLLADKERKRPVDDFSLVRFGVLSSSSALTSDTTDWVTNTGIRPIKPTPNERINQTGQNTILPPSYDGSNQLSDKQLSVAEYCQVEAENASLWQRGTSSNDAAARLLLWRRYAIVHIHLLTCKVLVTETLATDIV